MQNRLPALSSTFTLPSRPSQPSPIPELCSATQLTQRPLPRATTAAFSEHHLAKTRLLKKGQHGHGCGVMSSSWGVRARGVGHGGVILGFGSFGVDAKVEARVVRLHLAHLKAKLVAQRRVLLRNTLRQQMSNMQASILASAACMHSSRTLHRRLATEAVCPKTGLRRAVLRFKAARAYQAERVREQ